MHEMLSPKGRGRPKILTPAMLSSIRSLRQKDVWNPPSIRAIAAELGVSPRTIRRGLDILSKQRLRSADITGTTAPAISNAEVL